MQRSILFITLLSGLILLAGCGKTTYNLFSPNTLNTPMLQKQYDFNLTGNIGMGNGGLNAQGAFSPLNHLIVFGNAMNPGGWKNKDSAKRAYEYGLGYYAFIQRKEDRDIEVSLIAGYGTGRAGDYVNQYAKDNAVLATQNLYSMFTKQFMQPSFDFIHKTTTLSLSLKVTRNDMLVYVTPVNYELSPFNNSSRIIMTTVEPAVTIRYHHRYADFFFQYKIFIAGDSANYTHLVSSSDRRGVQSAFGISAGITFNYGNLMNILHPYAYHRQEY